MRKALKSVTVAMAFAAAVQPAFSGNPDRAGQAGATELLINPWARSSGMASAGTASARGLEAQWLNIAGMAFTEKTEVLFCNTQWLVGSGVMINSFGLSQKIGEAGVLGLSVMNMSFGDIEITTADVPDGGIGTFSPNYLNIGLSYAKSFSNSINGGLTVRVINQNIQNLSATGVAFDAGVSYTTRLGSRDKEKNKDNLQFGIALKNVGPPMTYSGDGLGVRGSIPGGDRSLTLEYRAAQYEMPSSLHIGATYHWRNLNLAHRVSGAVNFTSNSFTRDLMNFGLEYSFKDLFMLRGGYVLQMGSSGENNDIAISVLTGPTAGATVNVPLTKKGSEKKTNLGIDYSFRSTNPFAGVHAIGVRLSL